jgi:hypothetical protein
MIKMGVKYGYLTTGEAFVCLHIRGDDPKTRYYYLTEPQSDVKQSRSNQNQDGGDSENFFPFALPSVRHSCSVSWL